MLVPSTRRGSRWFRSWAKSRSSTAKSSNSRVWGGFFTSGTTRSRTGSPGEAGGKHRAGVTDGSGHGGAEPDLAGRAFPDDVVVARTRPGEVGDFEPVDPPVGSVGDDHLLELAFQHGPVTAGEDLAGSTVAAAEGLGGDVLAVADAFTPPSDRRAPAHCIA